MDSTKIWNKQYILILAANTLSWFSYYIVTTILASYMDTAGMAVSLSGIAGGIFAFTSMFTRPLSGFAADLLNRKRLFAGCFSLMAVCLCLYTVIPTAAAILIFRGLQGIGFGFSSTACMTLISEVSPKKRIGEAVSYYGVVSVVPMALGPVLGIQLSKIAGYRSCLVAGTVLSFAAAAIAISFPYKRDALPLEKTAKREKRIGKGIRRFIEPRLLDLTVMHFTLSMTNGVISTFLVVYGASKGFSDLSLYYTVNAITVIILRILFAKKIDKLSMRTCYVPSFVLAIVSITMLGCATRMAMFVISSMLRAVASVFENTCMQTSALRSVAKERKGAATCTYFIGGDGGNAIGPMIAGALVGALGYSSMFCCFAIPIAASLVWFLLSPWNRLKAGEIRYFDGEEKVEVRNI